MSQEGKKTKPVPPGRILAGAEVARLIDLKFPTRNEFAYKAGLDPKKVSDLVNGRKKMDANSVFLAFVRRRCPLSIQFA
jgi:plasmid maintenance system antidote protein VapI